MPAARRMRRAGLRGPSTVLQLSGGTSKISSRFDRGTPFHRRKYSLMKKDIHRDHFPHVFRVSLEVRQLLLLSLERRRTRFDVEGARNPILFEQHLRQCAADNPGPPVTRSIIFSKNQLEAKLVCALPFSLSKIRVSWGEAGSRSSCLRMETIFATISALPRANCPLER